MFGGEKSGMSVGANCIRPSRVWVWRGEERNVGRGELHSPKSCMGLEGRRAELSVGANCIRPGRVWVWRGEERNVGRGELHTPKSCMGFAGRIIRLPGYIIQPLVE